VIRVLIVFDRTGQRQPLYCLLGPVLASEATAARLRAEEEFGGPGIEIALLSADSIATMRRTHGRYFPDPARPCDADRN
jgi:hypothetical protein